MDGLNNAVGSTFQHSFYFVVACYEEVRECVFHGLQLCLIWSVLVFTTYLLHYHAFYIVACARIRVDFWIDCGRSRDCPVLWGTKADLPNTESQMADSKCESDHSQRRQHGLSWLYTVQNEKSWLHTRRSGSPTGGIREEFDRVERALFDIFVANVCANEMLRCIYRNFWCSYRLKRDESCVYCVYFVL